MAKAIKRVWVMLLAVAIICLMAIGVLLGATSAKKDNANLFGSSNKIENVNETSEVEIPPISEEVLLDGTTCAEQATKWTEAINKALTGKHILVKLNSDWVAQTNSSYTTAFGVDTGSVLKYFDVGRIYIPENIWLTIDLNGHKIDRNLKSKNARDCGGVIHAYGNLIIKDSQFDNDAILEAYNKNPNIDFKTIISGGITGGKTINDGGAIKFYNTLIVESGMIYDNYADTQVARGGGALYALNHANLIMNGGLIFNNISNGKGAGIYAQDSTMDMYDGIILNNQSNISGGGIYAENATINIRGGIVSKNQAQGNGGGIYSKTSTLNMYDGIIEKNQLPTAPSHGAGVCNEGVVRNFGLQIDKPAYFNMYGGKIRDNFAAHVGGGLMIGWGTTAKIYGGEITNNVVYRHSAGISILDGSSLEMYGGKISNNKNDYKTSDAVATCGAGINIFRYSSFIMYGGEISENEIKSSSGYQVNGAGVTITGAGSAILYGGEINNNRLINSGGGAFGAGIYLYHHAAGGLAAPVLNIAGPVKVYENNIDGNPSDIYLSSTDKINITQAISTESDKAYVGVSLASDYGNNAFTNGYSAYNSGVNPKNIFYNNIGNSLAMQSGNEVVFGENILKVVNYDFIYKEDNTRKNYKDNNLIHSANDFDKVQRANNGKLIIGNITPNTKLTAFVENILFDKTKLIIYNQKGEIAYNKGVYAEGAQNMFVATGWKLETLSSGGAVLETAFVSVLGDVVADGVINTLDITYINRIAKGEIKLETLSIEEQLAAMVDNKGKVTSTDGKILLNVIGGNTEVDDYFENVANITNGYMLWDLSIDSVTGKTYRVCTELTETSLANNAIIGNIAPKTKASDLKTSLASQLGVDISAIEIYKANGAVAGDNDYIGTGFYINYNGNTANKIYLTVLGDLTGDGVVNTADITYLNRIINGNIELATDNIKDKLTILTASIQNKGNLTTADSETLLNYIGGNADMTKYY